jgi:hypothetical protein
MVSPETITDITSAWSTDDGATATTVYAGTSVQNAPDGVLVIVRQNDAAGTTTQTVVPVRSGGPLTLVSGPSGAAAETAAQRTGVLVFKTASGSTHRLDLATNSVR